MDPVIAKSLSTRFQISIDYVVREYYEMVLLKELFSGPFGASLVFKGGTALRLAYKSPRFSEDLDFDLLTHVEIDSFAKFIDRARKRYSDMVGLDAADKRDTTFIVLKIASPILSRAFSIKIEASKRNVSLKRENDYTQRVMVSETNPISVLANVSTLDRILFEKTDALKNRRAARDVFDYWYINQLLNKEVKPDYAGFDQQVARSELRRLLPKPYWQLVDSWLE